MAIDVKMPQLGESVSEGTVTKYLVKEGDVVIKDQPLLEVATDKADTEVLSPAAGRVVRLQASEGDVLPVNSILLQLDDSPGADVAPTGADAARKSLAAPRDAANAPPPPPRSAPQVATSATLATPAARQSARENSLELENVRGTGERGRIGKDDVLRAASEPRELALPADPAPLPAAPSPAKQVAQLVNDGGGFVPPIPGVGFRAFKVPPYRPSPGDKVVPFTRRRRITADHMTYSKFASPHVVTVAEVDLFRASKLREANKDRYKKEGLALTMLAFAVVATARALREHPELNARVLDDSFVLFKDVNIGVAVDSPDGLVVPVVRRADELGVRGIVRAIDEVAKRAKSGKITADDLSSSTFSVSNPGLKGNLFGGAIISQPNVGILRMGEIQKRVVVVEGPEGEDHMAIHPVMFMALSYDHRIVDGVNANSFLWRVTEILEKADFEV